MNDIGECTCADGYTGTLCEVDVNECDSSPCVGEGSYCQNFENRFECVCPAGMTGKQGF